MTCRKNKTQKALVHEVTKFKDATRLIHTFLTLTVNQRGIHTRSISLNSSHDMAGLNVKADLPRSYLQTNMSLFTAVLCCVK